MRYAEGIIKNVSVALRFVSNAYRFHAFQRRALRTVCVYAKESHVVGAVLREAEKICEACHVYYACIVDQVLSFSISLSPATYLLLQPQSFEALTNLIYSGFWLLTRLKCVNMYIRAPGNTFLQLGTRSLPCSGEGSLTLCERIVFVQLSIVHFIFVCFWRRTPYSPALFFWSHFGPLDFTLTRSSSLSRSLQFSWFLAALDAIIPRLLHELQRVFSSRSSLIVDSEQEERRCGKPRDEDENGEKTHTMFRKLYCFQKSNVQQ